MKSNEENIKYPKNIDELFKYSNIYLNRINIQQAAYKESTFSVDIFELILESLKSKENSHPMDYSFVESINKGQAIEYKTILYYIKQRLGIDARDREKIEVLKFFYKALKEEYILYGKNDEVKEVKKEKLRTIQSGLI